MCGQRATLFSNILQADLIWPDRQSAKQNEPLLKTNMSESFFTGTWQELLPFSTSQSTIQRPEVSFSFFFPETSGTGLCNPPSKANILAGEGPQTPYALGGCLPASPGLGG